MATERYDDAITETCPSCGLKGIWFCSSMDCPKKDSQKTVRQRWQDLANESPEEENESSQ